jgi:hypothetical protein
MTTPNSSPAVQVTDRDRDCAIRLNSLFLQMEREGREGKSSICTAIRIQQELAQHRAEAVANEKTRADLYETEYRRIVQASFWMHDDPTIKDQLVIGKSVLVDGLPILQRELTYAREEAHVLRTALATIIDLDDRNYLSRDPLDTEAEFKIARAALATVTVPPPRERMAGEDER